MHTITTFKHWAHAAHDEGSKLVAGANHMLHDRTFWVVMALIGLITVLFTVLSIFEENGANRHYYSFPAPYGTY